MPPPVRLLFGPMLIGVFFNTMLFGVMAVQMLIYFQTYKRDATWIKYFVLYLLVVETANTILSITLVYEPLVTRFGTTHATTYFPKTLAAEPIVTVLISTPIQIFMAWRIRIITKSNWIAGSIIFFAFVALAGGAWTGAMIIIAKLFALKPKLHWSALVWLLSSAVSDAIITCSLVFSLSRRRTGFNSTDDAINRIIRMTIQTGMITAMFAALDVISFMSLGHTTLNFVWDFALSKLYTNALLSSLNARGGWNGLATAHGEHNVLFGTNPSAMVSTSMTFQTYQSTNRFSGTKNTTGSSVYEAVETPISPLSPLSLNMRGKPLEFSPTPASPLHRESRAHGDTTGV